MVSFAAFHLTVLAQSVLKVGEKKCFVCAVKVLGIVIIPQHQFHMKV